MPILFKLGHRMDDPSLPIGEDRYRLNANIDPADERLIKTICLQKGALQLVTANLIHNFCNELRRNNIATNLDTDSFHFVLARLSGRDVELQGNALDGPSRVESTRDVGDGLAGIRTKVARVKKSTADAGSGGKSRGGDKAEKGKGRGKTRD